MIDLHSSKLHFSSFTETEPFLARLSTEASRPMALRRDEVFLWRGGEVPPGYRAYGFIKDITTNGPPVDAPVIEFPLEFEYLSHADVVRLDPKRGTVRTIYRRNSPHNTFLVTERCNHYCLMCSQPPRNIKDDWIVEEILEALTLISPETDELGFTGGEPTLLGERFLKILRTCKSYLPRTAIHILSNGRRFADPKFVEAFASIDHADMMVGIPLYSDVSTVHDFVVQADGAFDETVRGILNLKRHSQKVEIRIVIHQQTFDRLPQLAEFISRNFLFVDHVTLMGLEIMGFTKANLDKLWIDPIEYKDQLRDAVDMLQGHRINTSIYNHQLCLLDRELWPLARQSISDWKNTYMPECNGCTVMNQCAGFFASAVHRYSDNIKAVT